ncbi:Uncharacterised protein [uncultured archaeon]|nr:Uncharacterised protein [uncultured archaeon]
MGLFGKRREKVIDLRERYSSPSPRREAKTSSSQEDNSSLGFLGNLADSGNSSSSDVSWDNDAPQQNDYKSDYPEKKQKLARRLLDMTNKIEDLSNQIYHLKQRIELLEKKLKVNFE